MNKRSYEQAAEEGTLDAPDGTEQLAIGSRLSDAAEKEQELRDREVALLEAREAAAKEKDMEEDGKVTVKTLDDLDHM